MACRMLVGSVVVQCCPTTSMPLSGDVAGEQWVVADVDRHDGALDAATRGCEAVVHCTSNLPTAEATDIGGTSNLLAAAETAGVGHFLYVSIVGIEGVALPYYGAKVTAEQTVMVSVLPWTFLRTTQFHELLGEWPTIAAEGGPMLLAEGVRFRPVATSEVADRIVELVNTGASGRVRDLAGPEILSVEELAERHEQATGVHAPIGVAEAGTSAAAFLGGAQVGEDCDLGRIAFGAAG